MAEQVDVQFGEGQDPEFAAVQQDQQVEGLGQAVGEAALQGGDFSEGDGTEGTTGIESTDEDTKTDFKEIASLGDLLKAAGVDESKLSTESEADKANREAAERRELQQQLQLERYQNWIESIAKKQDTYREAAMLSLAKRIESGGFTREAAEKEFANIEKSVKRSANYSHTYNNSRDPKYHRSQGFTAFIDDDGHVWGDYQSARSDYGQPISPGIHLIMGNPAKPQEASRLLGPVVRREGDS